MQINFLAKVDDKLQLDIKTLKQNITIYNNDYGKYLEKLLNE